MRDNARQDHADEPDCGGVIPLRGDDQPRSRNAPSDAYCENYLQLHNWHTTIVRAGAQKDVVRERDRTRHAYGQWLFARSESNHEKFGTAKSEAWRVGARMPRVRRVE